MVIRRYLWRGMTWLLREERRREKLRQWYQIFISVLSYSYRQNSSLHLLISWYFIILYQGVSLVSNININSQSYFSKGSRWSLLKCSLRSSQQWLLVLYGHIWNGKRKLQSHLVKLWTANAIRLPKANSLSKLSDALRSSKLPTPQKRLMLL